MLAHKVKREKVRAKFDSGLLKIAVALKDTLHKNRKMKASRLMPTRRSVY